MIAQPSNIAPRHLRLVTSPEAQSACDNTLQDSLLKLAEQIHAHKLVRDRNLQAPTPESQAEEFALFGEIQTRINRLAIGWFDVQDALNARLNENGSKLTIVPLDWQEF